MRRLVVLLALMLGGCMANEDLIAAKMEAQDDASCRKLSAGKSSDAYTQCRKNLQTRFDRRWPGPAQNASGDPDRNKSGGPQNARVRF
jgi:hypothetical protein